LQTGVHADNAGFSSSISVLVVVYLVHGITKSEVRIIIVIADKGAGHCFAARRRNIIIKINRRQIKKGINKNNCVCDNATDRKNRA
jgi:hypothetical protein